MLIQPAYAQAAAPAGGGDLFVSLMPLVLIFVVFYFLLIRPQQQRMKQQRAMLDAIKKGDQVVTGGGIIGKVTRVEAGEATLMVEIAQNVTVKVNRGTIAEVLTKPVPVSNDNRDKPGAAATSGSVAGDAGLAGKIGRLFKR